MKRLITFLLVAFSISLLTWGQESSSQNSQSPFIGEWACNYSTKVWEREGENAKWKDVKLILRIEQYGNDLVIRGKVLFSDGKLYYYWDPCTIISASNSSLTIVKKSEEDYESDNNCWSRVETQYRLDNENGRIHLFCESYKLIYRYASGYEQIENLSTYVAHDWKDLYLYKNDNW